MEFGLPKCGLMILKREKKVKSEGISIPDGKKIKNIVEDGYNYLGILEIDGANHVEIKYQMKKSYIIRVRNILKSKLNGENIVETINS